MSLKVKEIEYKNFGNCLSISNGIIEAIVTIDVGPRIISFGYLDESNILFNDIDREYFAVSDQAEDESEKEKSTFYNYGGHRISVTPHTTQRKNYADNKSVVYSVLPDTVKFTQTIQEGYNMLLELEVMIYPDSKDMIVIHSLQSLSKKSQILGLSGVTELCKDGTLIIPQNQPEDNIDLPNRSFALWPYSKTDDERVFLGNKYITIRQDPSCNSKFKMGTNNYSNWTAYQVNGYLFIKNYVHERNAKYPDFNSSFEVYTDRNFLEISSLSPLYTIGYKETIRHVENWTIYKTNNKINAIDQDQIEDIIKLL